MFNSHQMHVTFNLALSSTTARKNFKTRLGQNNHFLITILVGLHEVETRELTTPETLSASWNPQDAKISARRSRSFAIQSLLAWTVDALDTYVKSLRDGYPGAVPDRAWIAEENGKQKTVGLSERLVTVGEAHRVPELTTAMLVMAVVWRNRLVHFQARNKVSSQIQSTLLRGHVDLTATYQGLDVIRMLKSIHEDRPQPPTLKEITALVRAAHSYVGAVDAHVTSTVDVSPVIERILTEYLGADRAGAQSRSANVWGKGTARASNTIAQILRNYGHFTDAVPEVRPSINHEYWENLCSLRPREAMAKFFA